MGDEVRVTGEWAEITAYHQSGIRVEETETSLGPWSHLWPEVGGHPRRQAQEAAGALHQLASDKRDAIRPGGRVSIRGRRQHLVASRTTSE